MLCRKNTNECLCNVPFGTLYRHTKKTILTMYSSTVFSQFPSDNTRPSGFPLHTISIIERDDHVCKQIQRLLKRTPLLEHLSAYKTISSAVADFAQQQPDILLINNSSTDMPNIQRIHSIHHRYPSVQILLTTTGADAESIRAVIASGVSGYLLQPIQPVHLISAMKELAGGGAPLSPHVARIVIRSLWASGGTVHPLLRHLTKREHDVLKLLAQGLSYHDISQQLGIQRGTVQRHLHSIYAKMNVRTRAEATHLYLSR